MWGIVWLASYPKSGNTWLRAFLANYLRNPDAPVPINDLPDFILGDNFLVHYAQFTGKKTEDLSPEEIKALRPKIHEWFASARGETVFVKTHNMLRVVDGQPLITPSATAGAIYLIRNPLDVVVSFAHHYQTPFDSAVETMCRDNHVLPPSDTVLAQVIGSWSQHVRTWTEAPGLKLHVMRYEDMLIKPGKTFGSLVKFLQLPKEPRRLVKALKFSSFRELRKQEDEETFVESRPDGKAKFFREGKARVWQDVLTEEQVARLVECHREFMIKFGYLTPKGKLRV
jgi:hypothetical protein